MKNVAYWTPLDDPLKGKTADLYSRSPQPGSSSQQLESILAMIPSGKKCATRPRSNGKLVDKVDSTYMPLTDFSDGFVNPASIERRAAGEFNR